MITRYDVIRGRWSSHFWVKCMFIQLFFLTKVKLVDEMIQSAYLCAILTCQAQKITTYLFRDFNLISNSRKIQDGHHCWWCHRPPAAPPPIKYIHLIEKITGFPLNAKSFRNTAAYQKLWGGLPSTPPPYSVGVEFTCTSEGKLL